LPSLVATNVPLVLAAHGSTDPRFAEVVDSLAVLVTGMRRGLDVRIGYLQHGPPELNAVAEPGVVVVPLLLTSGFHVRADIPAQAPGATISQAVGPDRRLTNLLVRRLGEAGWQREHPVVLAAAGSSDPRALADVHQVARDLGDEIGREVTAAFLSDGEPRLSEVPAMAVATYLLAPGHFADRVVECGAPIVAGPLGSDVVLAEIILDRYDVARLGSGHD
jgi:sirohydrochlorin ferrochelatase